MGHVRYCSFNYMDSAEAWRTPKGIMDWWKDGGCAHQCPMFCCPNAACRTSTDQLAREGGANNRELLVPLGGRRVSER